MAKYQRQQKPQGRPQEIILYQYEVCPFCNKVRAFLDYYKVCLGHCKRRGINDDHLNSRILILMGAELFLTELDFEIASGHCSKLTDTLWEALRGELLSW